MNLYIVLGVIGLLPYCPLARHREDKEHWYRKSQEELQRRFKTGADSRVAKNIILFVGDGMGVATVTAARILKGQFRGESGEEGQLSFETFPHLALLKTYNIDSQVGDSAACATALVCGVKGNLETVGLDNRGIFNDCLSSYAARVPSIFDWAQQVGKSTGIVTTTRVTHGTPAALYAHSSNRYWEEDGKVPEFSARACKDIARQLVEDEPGRQINVIFGGGRRAWLPRGIPDPENPGEEGRRTDNRNLIRDWLTYKQRRDLNAAYVWNKEQLDKVNVSTTDYILGLFAYSHMDFETDRDSYVQPSLTHMTMKAIEILRKNPHGYVLMVEAGRIDHAHHHNNAFRALVDTLALESAVETVTQSVDPTNSLVVVTSDHSHVFVLGGKGTPRGNPIFGLDSSVSDIDKLPYTTILYGNGPGYNHNYPGGRENLSSINTSHINYVQQAAVPRLWETHGAEDVPVYAHGPQDYLVSGSVDQTYVAHFLAYSACMGPYESECQARKKVKCSDSFSGQSTYRTSVTFLTLIVTLALVT